MPKIIENLDQTIISSARELFHRQGFEHTNMRQIADKSGIAVGTLYRYYKDKDDLYMQIMMENWQKTMRSLEKIMQDEAHPETALRKMLEKLIHTLQSHQSISQLLGEVAKMYARHTSENRNDYFVGTHGQISRLFSDVLKRMLDKEIRDEDEVHLLKLGSYAFIMAVDSCMLRAVEVSQQAEFITNILYVYLRCDQPTRKFIHPPVKP